MAKIRYIKWRADEWLAGVAVLTNAERGVYSTICNLIYASGHAVRIDPSRAQQVFGCDAVDLSQAIISLKKHGKVVGLRGGKVTVKRCEETLQSTSEIIAKRRSAGSLGGRPPNESNNIQKPNGFENEKLTRNKEQVTKKEEENPPCGPPLGDQQTQDANHVGEMQRPASEAEDALRCNSGATFQPASSRPARKQDDRGTRLSPDWEPSAELWQFVLDSGLDPRSTVDEFRDYWRAVPGAKARKLDWEATFRNHCRHQAERQRKVVPLSRARSSSLLAFASGIQGD